MSNKQNLKEIKEYCDQCSAFKLLPDPDSYDWLGSYNMKAVCLEVNGVIAGSLTRPSECINICKPLFCPNLGRELSKEEKIHADNFLQWAKNRMNTV